MVVVIIIIIINKCGYCTQFLPWVTMDAERPPLLKSQHYYRLSWHRLEYISLIEELEDLV